MIAIGTSESWNGTFPTEHLVGEDADRVEVGGRADVRRERLLGRHVGGRPHRRPRDGQRVAGTLLHDLGEPEVRDLDAPARGHHEVLGLQVPVDDPAGVRVGEARQDALEDARGLEQRETGEPPSQRPAVEVLHGDERGALVLEVLVHRDDVRVVQ